VSNDQRGDGVDPPSLAADGRYESPKLSIYESEAPMAWADARVAEATPDDTLKPSPASSGSPEVLHWSAPQPGYDYPDPEVFVAPADPARRVSGPKKVPKKTQKAGKETRAHATKTKLTGHDAFGGALCTCDLVCTCNLVCTCESVAACSCVADAGAGGGRTPCTCNAMCTCQGVSTCTCQADQPCSCQAQPF